MTSLTSLHPLEKRFADAGLAAVVSDAPLAAARAGLRVDVVQVDIARPAKSRELFRVFRGAVENRVEVTTVDRRERQLVMLVEEPRRGFEAVVSSLAPLEPGVRVLREEGRRRVVELFTDARKRHFLCGMDEQHLFIAQLPRAASSVGDAHRALRAFEVPASLRANGGRVRRQGEWFFLPLADAEAREIAALPAAAHRRKVGIAQAAGIPRAGRPHVADEVCVSLAKVYVRGRVKHPDHRTVQISDWHRAVANREAFDRPAGVLWVD